MQEGRVHLTYRVTNFDLFNYSNIQFDEN